ncbi:type II toxin-antitoxin system Phd/YefM family antitoxin [Burkholderia sp. lig30]|uniref:type II toxin-antitoxin system Phd/YefM family antitoxin n=1 Tax=Burkholderia sp. lig30 TaxID=1192124 RepID=UPI00128F409F|nr:type II toxin-antitoxin system Phd/YefM family antitoxin [Burkholderia sp. lig30]
MLERFVEHSPVAIMTRLVMQCAVHDDWIDDAAGMDDETDAELLREALFACVVDALVALADHAGSRSGTRAAPAAMPAEFAPAVTALHDRMSRLRGGWGRALVKDSADLLRPFAMPPAGERALAAGWRLRVLGGRDLPDGFACVQDGTHALPVHDPELETIVDLLPCERGRAHERAFVGALIESVRPGELWVIDGGVNTAAILAAWPCRGGALLVREQEGAPAWRVLEDARDAGVFEGGRVFEQAVAMADDDDAELACRRIEWRQDGSAGASMQTTSVLTNAPAAQFDAVQIVRLAQSASRTMLPPHVEAASDAAAASGVPARAALLARGIVAVAYNVFGMMSRAACAALALDAREAERLPAHIAAGVRAAYAGMMIALPPEWWRRYDQVPATTLGHLVHLLATHVDPRSERRKRRDHRVSGKSHALRRAATLDRLLHDDGDDPASNPFSPRTISMATRDFSSNPSKALRDATKALVMVTKYNRPIALLVSIDDWNRLLCEVRESGMSRWSGDDAGIPTARAERLAARRAGAGASDLATQWGPVATIGGVSS